MEFVRPVDIEHCENKSNIIYDQRQTGKFNIHLSIKDVAIIDFGGNEFLDETNNNNNEKEDYYYDEDDLTIKPWFSTSTKKPFSNSSTTNTTPTTIASNSTTIKNDYNITKAPNQTNITSIPYFNIVNSTPTLPAPTRKPLFNNNKLQDIPVQIIMEPVLIPKLRTSTHKSPLENNKDSRVVRLKSRYNNYQYPRMIIKCNNDGFIDEYGNCRPKRSTTIRSLFLKKMFNFLKDLTIKQFNRDSSTSPDTN